jgi:phage terminase large subunit GpA-like protein
MMPALSDAQAVVNAAWRRAWAPPPRITVSEWADENRMLSSKASSEPGPWRTARTPYLREIMDCLSATSPVEEVVFMKGAQIGGTEAGNNWIGYVIDIEPAPIMMVQPTTDTAKRYAKQRITPMLDETPALRESVKENRSRDDANTMLMKDFRGGVLVIAGANSAAGLRSMPVRFLFLDEVDAYPHDVDGEGDPVALAEKRTSTFARRKVLKVSTPTVKDFSKIEAAYLASDRRRYYVPCPHCSTFDWLRWANIRWPEAHPQFAYYVCEHCGAEVSEHHKNDMLAAGEWRAENPGVQGRRDRRLSSVVALFAARLGIVGQPGAAVRRRQARARWRRQLGDEGIRQHRARRDVGRQGRARAVGRSPQARRECACAAHRAHRRAAAHRRHRRAGRSRRGAGDRLGPW